MVDVPVDDADPLAVRVEEPRQDRDVVEEAESHGARRAGVVARGSNGREPRLDASVEERLAQGETRPGSLHRRLVGVGAQDRVGVEMGDAARDRVLHTRDVFRGVDGFQLGRGGCPGRDRLQIQPLQRVQERRQPCGTLRMAGAGVMLLENGVAGESGAHGI